MKYSIASYSFHRALESGKQDMFGYITDCKEFGCSQLDPWNGHLVPLIQETEQIRAGADPLVTTFSPAGLEYVARVKAAADAAGLPIGSLALDGAHIYEPTPEARALNRASAYRWLDVAHRLNVNSIRIDSGGTADLPDDMFAIIVEGLKDIVQRARALGIRTTIENHWGASNVPVNLIRMLHAVEGLDLLFDSHNFAPGLQEQGWQLCVPYATDVHIKTFRFDEHGNEPDVDIPRVVAMLVDAGYKGCWGIESVPRDGDEYGAIRKTIALIERSIAAA
ncbi:MAG: TIM barrel protein [Anaerolineae bacterium]|nr:TIM barrel protein [Anaerolineae bacterium]MBN8620764.1 TIM barrel protein [Anaerolineae bacterium]